jgi:hypothetical protein
MAESHDIHTEALIDLAHFEDQMSLPGRLLHYAQDRIRTFWPRQFVTLFGAGIITFLGSAPLGLGLAPLAVFGEVCEFFCLRWVMLQLERGNPGTWPLRIVRGAAFVQSGTLAFCVALTWRSIPLHEARFFSAACLIGAVVNAGLSRPHLRAVVDLRLVLFAATLFALMALDLALPRLGTSQEYGFFVAAVVLLIYISIVFINAIEHNYLQRRANEHALLKHQHDQELARIELARSHQNSQLLALVAKYANDSILVSGPDGRIQWVNDAFSRITDYAFGDAVGRLPGEILNAPGTDPDTTAQLDQARDSQRPVRVEVLNRAKSGRLFWVETSITPIFDDQGQLRHWIAVERDITEAKERQAELARAHVAMEEAGQAKSRFLANMSHEIRTPMNGVIGVAELLADTKLSPAQREYVETIVDSGRLLLEIINDILDLAKLQSGKSTLENRPFSLAGALNGVLRILEPVATKKQLELRLILPKDATVLGDEGKLRQIVLNLAGNAVKFTREGAVTITVHPPDSSHDMLQVDVADTGIGIAQDQIGRIFDSFSQADDGISRQFGGTGLGLTICSMLAEQMGGGISVSSQVGHGSVFTLQARMPRTAMVAPGLQLRNAAPLRPGLRVMIAEDNRTNMMIVRKMLKDQVASLIEAENGAQAVDLYRARAVDLVLMDVSMPVMDGLQATREIRAHEASHGLRRCPVVALTANAFGEDRAACWAAGLDGFLVKPLSRADLLAEIEVHCPADLLPRRKKGL